MHVTLVVLIVTVNHHVRSTFYKGLFGSTTVERARVLRSSLSGTTHVEGAARLEHLLAGLRSVHLLLEECVLVGHLRLV